MQLTIKTTELAQENEGKVQEGFKIKWHFPDEWQESAEDITQD